MTRLASALALGVLYVLTLVSGDPIDLAIGVLLGTMLVMRLGGRLRLAPDPGVVTPAQRIVWFVPFVAAVLADIIQGTWDVALRVLHLRRLERPGVVRIPIGERSEHGVAVASLATTLSPGSVLIDVDWERRDLVLHVIDASDPDQVRERLQRFYDRYQRRVFP
jgi:multisubunit Na+/H+ antiporter MnhE subunit